MKLRVLALASAASLGLLLSLPAPRGASAQQTHSEEVDPQETSEADAGALDAAAPLPEVRALIPDAATPVVSGRGITVPAAEVYRRVGDSPEPVQRAFAANPALLDELVDRIVADRLLANEARRLGLERDPAVRAAVERALVARLRATVINPGAGDATAVTMDDIRNFYAANAYRFHIPERRRVRVIFMTVRRDAERVLRLARMRRGSRARHDFRDLAREHNTDPELLRTTGDLRDVVETQSDLDSSLRSAIFAIAEPGDVHDQLVSGRWRGTSGYFIVRLTARRQPIERTLSESADWIRQRLVLERRVQAERAMLERLRREAGVTQLPARRVVEVVLPDAGAR